MYKVNDRVYIEKGNGYHDISTYQENFKKAKENLHGFIDAIYKNSIIIILDNGLRVKTSNFAIENE